MSRSPYSFGDSDRAAERLRRLAEVFEAPSRAFLGAVGARGGALAIDLGCGPGLTTRLIAEVCGTTRTLGLDASPSFVALAREGAPYGVSFAVHDVTSVPLPEAPADLVYARYLVSHLSEPAQALRAWGSQLRLPGGRLLLDEVEWIRTEIPGFRSYLGLVEAMLDARGQRLFIGGHLEALARGAGRLVHSELAEHEVAARDAAALFSMNLESFREDETVRERASESELDALATELASIRGGDRDEAFPLWGLRQVAIEIA